jgi:hypothetical protein
MSGIPVLSGHLSSGQRGRGESGHAVRVLRARLPKLGAGWWADAAASGRIGAERGTSPSPADLGPV